MGWFQNGSAYMVCFPHGGLGSAVELRKDEDNKAIPLMFMLLLSGMVWGGWAVKHSQPLRATSLGGSLK